MIHQTLASSILDSKVGTYPSRSPQAARNRLMPPMEMLFHVDPRTLSDGVKPGDKIEFGVEGKTYKIQDIKVIEHTK